MADTTRSFWIESPGEGRIRDATLPRPGPDDVMVRALYSGISRGTETLVFAGRVPASQYQAMRAPFQEGEFPGPVKYGYISVGTVEQGPDRLRGRDVFCLYPHQDRYLVPATAVTPLPDGVPPQRAVLAANMETAVNALWDAQPRIGERIIVIGGGVLGMLVAWLCSRIPGTDTTLVDVNTARAATAAALGVDFAAPDRVPGEADLLIHASGHPSGLVSALELAAPEARIIELSWYGEQAVPLPLGEAFHSRRLTIRSSQVGRLPADMAPRWDYARRMAVALGLIADPALGALITGESPFEELPEVLARLTREPGDTLCHRIRY